MAKPASLPQRVITAFGGLTKTSKALGGVPVSTVDGWVRNGKIPDWRLDAIRAAAERNGVTLPAEMSESAA